MEELRRQAGWAKTFGLPLELISADEAARAVPGDDDGGRARRGVPADRRLRRPVPAHVRAAWPGRRVARGRGHDRHARHGASTSSAGGCGACAPSRGDRSCEVVVNAGGMFAGEIGRMAGVTVPIVPMAHEYLITKPLGLPLGHADHAGPVAARVLPARGRPGWSPAGTSATRRRGGSTGSPPTSTRKLLEEDWDRFAPLMENAVRRVPVLEDAEVVKLINGPEAFTPDGEFILGRVRGARVLGRGRVLRARDRRRRRDGPAHGRVDRRGPAGVRRVAHGLAAVRSALRRARDYRLARTVEVYSTYYDVRYPGQERLAGRPLRVSPTYARLVGAGRVVGREVRAGSGRTGSSRTPPPATRRCGRAGGRARSGRRRSGPSTSRAVSARRCSTRPRSPRSR